MANMVIRSLSKIIAGDHPDVHESHEPNGGRVQSSEHAIFSVETNGAFRRPHGKEKAESKSCSGLPSECDRTAPLIRCDRMMTRGLW